MVTYLFGCIIIFLFRPAGRCEAVEKHAHISMGPHVGCAMWPPHLLISGNNHLVVGGGYFSHLLWPTLID
jgi:hypothetical protein